MWWKPLIPATPVQNVLTKKCLSCMAPKIPQCHSVVFHCKQCLAGKSWEQNIVTGTRGKKRKKYIEGKKTQMKTNTMKVKRGFKQPNSLLYWHWVARSQTGETELKSPYLICTCPENQNCETHHFQYISLKINSSKHQQAHQILLFYWFYCQVSKNQHFSTLSFIFSGYQKSSAF